MPANWEIFINGVSKTSPLPWSIQETQRASATFRWNLIGQRVAEDDEVVVEENGTRIFGGIVQTAREIPFEAGKSVMYRTFIEASDFKAFALRRFFNGRVQNRPLKDILTDFVDNYLADYGVTLDPAQVTGPTTVEQVFDFQTVHEVITKLTDDVNYVWEIDYNKVLRAYAPGVVAAPVDILDTLNNSFGPISTEISRLSDFPYTNYVKSRYKVNAIAAHGNLTTTGNFSNGETVTVGSLTATFGSAPTTPNAPQVGATIVDSLNNLRQSFDNNPEFAGFVNVGTQQLIVTALTPGVSGNSLALAETCANASWGPTVVFIGGVDANINSFVIAKDDAEIALVGRYEFVLPASIDDDLDATQAQALADAYLAQHVITPIKVEYQSFVRELHPGQTQHITVAARAVDDDFLITDVEITSTVDGIVSRSKVSAVLGTTVVDNWMSLYKQWTSGKKKP